MTNTAIIFSSKYGTTAKVGTQIADALSRNTTLLDLKDNPKPDLSSAERIVLGCPIYAGKPSKKMEEFIATNAATLQSRPLALFVWGMESDPSKRDSELATAFPKALRDHAVGCWFTGGEFQLHKLNFFERTIIKRIADITESVSAIDSVAIAELVSAID